MSAGDTELARLLAQGAAPAVARKPPKGWEPGVSWDGQRGTVTTEPLDSEPNEAVWRELVADWGLDPQQFEIVPGSLQFRGWDASVGQGETRRLKYYRATIVARTDGPDRGDVDALCRLAEKGKPPKPAKPSGVGAPFVISWNDLQIGKGEGGGTPATVERIIASYGRIRDRLRELDRMKRRPASVVVANTGDPIEKVSGHYSSQAFTVDLNEREQLRVARRLLFRLVDMLVGDGYEVLVTAVPCNHGENRAAGGKAQTTADDNASLTIVENVEEACAANPDRFDGVSFAYASDLTLTVPVAGVNLGMTHGHQVRGQGGAVAVEKWWQGQIMGNTAVAAADILMTAHKHHLAISETTGRTVIMAPAMDGGSLWWTSATGQNSPPGMLTVTVGDQHPRGWADLAIL